MNYLFSQRLPPSGQETDRAGALISGRINPYENPNNVRFEISTDSIEYLSGDTVAITIDFVLANMIDSVIIDFDGDTIMDTTIVLADGITESAYSLVIPHRYDTGGEMHIRAVVFIRGLDEARQASCSIIVYTAAAILDSGAVHVSGAPSEGHPFVMYIRAAGSDTLAFQWYCNGAAVPITNNDTLLIDPLAAADTGSYFCIVSNPYGADTSSAYHLVLAEATPVTVEFTSGSGSGRESQPQCTVAVSISPVSAQELSLSYAVTCSTAVRDTDFVLADGALLLAAGIDRGGIVFSHINDSLDEGDETFTLNLLSVSGNARLGDITSHAFTIIDDEAVRVYFPRASSNGPETSAPCSIAVELSVASAFELRVNYTLVPDSSTAGTEDFTLANGTLVFPPSVVLCHIPFTVADDELVEPDESFLVVLSDPSGQAELGSISSHRFTIISNDCAVNISAAANGSVSLPGDTVVAAGTVIEVSAEPDSNFHFSNWEVSGGVAILVNENPGQFTVSGDGSVTARFSSDTCTIAVSAGAHGSVSFTGDTVVAWGVSLIVTATADSHYNFHSWSLSGGVTALSSGNPGEFSVTGDGAIAAVFAPDTFTVFVQAPGNGSVSPSGETRAAYGVPLSVTAVPQEHYHFQGWVVAGGVSALSGANPGSFTVTADGTVAATFAPDTYDLTIIVPNNGSISKSVPGTSFPYSTPVTLIERPRVRALDL